MDPVSSYDMEDVRGTDRDSLGEIDLSWIVRSETATKDSLLKEAVKVCVICTYFLLCIHFSVIVQLSRLKKNLGEKKKKKKTDSH